MPKPTAVSKLTSTTSVKKLGADSFQTDAAGNMIVKNKNIAKMMSDAVKKAPADAKLVSVGVTVDF